MFGFHKNGAQKTTLKQYYHKNWPQIYWYNLTKAKNQFKPPKDTSGVKLSDFENF